MPGARLYGDDWQDPPVPADRAFVFRVIAELRAADDFARDEMGLPRRGIQMPPRNGVTRRREPEIKRAYRSVRGHCAGCGCSWEDSTRGCGNCAARHGMRLYNRLDRLCRMIEESFSRRDRLRASAPLR